MILLFGPEANEHVLSTAAHTFEWGEAMQALVAVDGPTALIVSDGDDHRRRRPLEQTAFPIHQINAPPGSVQIPLARALDTSTPGSQHVAHLPKRTGDEEE